MEYNVDLDDINLFVKHGPEIYEKIKNVREYIEEGMMRYWEESKGPNFEYLENCSKKILEDAFNEGFIEYKWGNIVMWKEDGLVMCRLDDG